MAKNATAGNGILFFPDDRLRTECSPVTEVTDEIRALAKRMLREMYATDGVGLAAPQIGELIQLVVIDVDYAEPSGRRNPYVLINPTIVVADGEGRTTDEWDRDFDPTLFVSTHADQQRQRQEKESVTAEEIMVFCVLWPASVFGATYLGIGRSMPLVFLFLVLVGFPIASCFLACVVVTGRWALARRRAERRTKAMADATDGGASLPTPADATWLLLRYEEDRSIGDHAKRAIRQLEAVSPIRERLTAAVRGRFADGSLSQDRFMGTLDPALRTVEENVAMAASIVAGLDGIGGRIAQVRKNKGRVEAMARILDDNDAIISGLRDLEESLLGLSVTEHHEASREIIETLAEAADDATQYAGA